MGGKKSTTTQNVTIPKEVMDRYNAVNARAETTAANPFQKFGTNASDFVAQINQQQTAGINSVNEAAGSYKPYMAAGAGATMAGMGPASEGIDRYMSPYIRNVADTTGALMRQQQEQAQSGALGTAISSGAFGGDRAGIAAANLQQQNALGYGKTMADIYNTGYTQALGASQSDLARQMAGGAQLAGIGAQTQAAGLQGAEAQIAAGGLQQQTEQAGKTALVNQFMQEQGYPFQVAQFLANIAMGTGALSGSTTATTQPGSFWSDRRLKHDVRRIGHTDDGQPIYKFKYNGSEQTQIGLMADQVEKHRPDAVGTDPKSGYKYVDYDRATKAEGGGVAGPYGSQVGSQPFMEGYIPQAYLPVGELMMADPNLVVPAPPSGADYFDQLAKLGQTIGDFTGKAYGGGVDAPNTARSYLSDVIDSQKKEDKPELRTASTQAGESKGGLGETLGNVAKILSFFKDGGVVGRQGYGRGGGNDAPLSPHQLELLRRRNELRDNPSLDFPQTARSGDVQLPNEDAATRVYGFKQFGDYNIALGEQPPQADPRAGLVGRRPWGPHHWGVSGEATGQTGIVPAARPANVDLSGFREDAGSPDLSSQYMADEASNIRDNQRAGAFSNLNLGVPISSAGQASATAGITGGFAPTASARPEARPAGVVPTDASSIAKDTLTALGSTPSGLAPLTSPRSQQPYSASLPENVTSDTDFMSGVRGLSQKYRVSEGDILRLMNAESDIDPSRVNSVSGATGLIGFMPKTAASLGTSTDELARMSRADQLKFVDKYLSGTNLSGVENPTFNDLYAAVLWPDAVGKPDDTVLFGEGSTSYEQNAPLDLNGDGSVTKGEAGTWARNKGVGVSTGAPSSSDTSGLAGANMAAEPSPTGGKAYGDRNTFGQMMYDPKTNKLSQDALLSIMSGVGSMLASPSQFLLPTIGAGLAGGANTFANLRQQAPERMAKQLENSRDFLKTYYQYAAQNPALTMQDFADQTGMAIPPNDLLPEGTTGSVKQYNGVSLNPIMPGLNEMITHPDGTVVRAYNDVGFLKALLAEQQNAVAARYLEPEVVARTQNMIDQIALNSGRVPVEGRMVDGKLVKGDGQQFTTDPFVAQGQSAAVKTTIGEELTKKLGADKTSVQNEEAAVNRMVETLAASKGMMGAGANVISQLNAFAETMGLSSGQYAALNQELNKNVSSFLARRSADTTNPTDYSREIEAGALPNMDKQEAVNAYITAQMQAVVEREKARIKAVSEAPDLISAADAEKAAIANFPFEETVNKYYQDNLRKFGTTDPAIINPVATASSPAPAAFLTAGGTQERWDAATPELKAPWLTSPSQPADALPEASNPMGN